MHSENKLTTHAKKVVSSSETKISDGNQQQSLGTKGSHGVKAHQISPGLNSVGPSGVGGGITMLKTKNKRERAISMDTGDLRDSLEPDAKDAVLRSKRRCVLEKKQPYSGDEWCSGADTEEEEDKANIVVHRERMITGSCTSAGVGGQSSAPPPGYGFGPGGLRTDLPRPAQQVVYVFTTGLANSAAEAVMNGHTDSIVMFHQQNVPRTKLDQCVPAARKLPSLPEQLSSRSTPPMGTPKSQTDTPRPASVGGAVGAQAGGGQPQETNLLVHQTLDGHSSSSSHQPLQGNTGPPVGSLTGPGGVEGVGSMAHPTAGVSPTSSVPMLPAHLQDDGQRGPCTMDGLSKEQIEHRERSLQTLRDIERLLLRSGVSGGGPGELVGPNGNTVAIHSNSINRNNNNNTDNGGRTQEGSEASKNSEKFDNNIPPLSLSQVAALKKHEEPLQSIMSQTQSLGGSRFDDPMGPNMSLPTHPHHHLSSPPELDLGPLQSADGLTQEQMAWRKLQEEYYQEKRRQQEMHPHSHPQHYRVMAEMGMPRGPHLMIRGPPPPYHGKADEHWGPGPMMGGSMGSNPRLMDIHQDGPQGPRFVGQLQRGPSGARGYPGSPGRVVAMESLGLQRPGMVWVEDLPINIGGGRTLLHGCYPSDGPGGPPQPLHNDPERHLLREEVLRIMEKRQLQRMEQERFAAHQQQQEAMGHLRLLDGTGRPSLPNQEVAGGPHADPLDFPQSQAIMNSPLGKMREGDGPSLRDLGDSPLSTNLTLNVNLNAQEQQALAQKLRGANHGPVGDILSPEEISHLRAGHNGRSGASKVTGQEGTVQFLNQRFCGGQSERSFVQQSDQANFRPDQQETSQMGNTSHPSQMPVEMGPKGSDSCPHHPSNLPVNVNSMGSPAMAPPHPLKSPSIGQEPSPLMPSPSASVLKSPTPGPTTSPLHPPLPTASRAGTPSSTSMKSPPVIGTASLGRHSPSGSPGHQKSPVMNMASPTWTASPKTNMPSPGRPPNGKGMGNGAVNSETGPTLPPKSSNSTVISKAASLNSSMPCTSSPDAPPLQNPLSLIMSQMSKYAMSSSAPLYHEAIKTISTSDDEMMPDRPLLPGESMEGTHHPSSQMLLSAQSGMGAPGSPQSPIGMLLQQQQQQLSHGAPGSMLSSPNLMSMSGMNSGMVGGAGGPSGGIGPGNSTLHPQNAQMMGFLRMQASSQGPLHSPVGPLSQQYSQHPDDMLTPQQFHLLGKGLPHQQPTHPSDSFPPMRMSDGPDLSDVIRPSHTGIPEFDLSRIIPSDKPSSTLQYFPKNEGMSQPQPNAHHSQGMQQPPPTQLLKQLSSAPHHSNAPSSNPHLANLQNMMAEQQLSIHPSHYGIRPGMSQGGGRGMVVGPVGPMGHPGHMMVRTGLGPQQQQQYHQQQQQVLMSGGLQHHPSHSHPSMMSPQQQHTHNLMAQQSLMMMQAKQRGMPIPGEQLGQQGPLMSPQGLIMGPSHPGMMGPQSLRQRGMSLNSPLGYAPGNVHNMPF